MLTVDDLKRFAAVCGRCLTLFEPLRSDLSPAAKPEARVNAAIAEADRILSDHGWSEAEREDSLRPLRRIGTNHIWPGRKGSLLVFRSREFTHATFWPDYISPRVHFGQQFLVLPLLPGVISNHSFWLLSLANKGVRLYRGTRETLTEFKLPCSVPRNLAEAGIANGSAANVDVVAGDGRMHQLHEYFRAIDRGIRPLLQFDRQPLILAGITRELSLYGRVNTYSPILEQAIHGCPDYLTQEMLHSRAAALSAGYAFGAPDKALRDMEDADGRGLLSNDAEDIEEASQLGRIEHLLLSLPCDPSEEDAVNSAALATIRHAGRLTVLDHSRLPLGAAAILRFREAPIREQEAVQVRETWR